ncbi:MAG: hypothetical protein GKR99_04295 [Rhodobacteraceae bacterium]|nr:hypothetical protein [Paracoccaceae bacterium]
MQTVWVRWPGTDVGDQSNSRTIACPRDGQAIARHPCGLDSGRNNWSCQSPLPADCVEKLRNQSVADFLRKPMKRNSRKALTTRQRMAARERM